MQLAPDFVPLAFIKNGKMNLQEFLDKLTPEDRQIVIDHFVSSMQGQTPQEPVVIRRTAKISTLGTEEEMLNEIAQVFNMPVERFGDQHVKEKLADIRNQFEKSEAIIKPYKDFLLKNKAREDKYDEAYDIGKFLISINGEYNLEIPTGISSIPDFIMTDGTKRIGIEHTRLINNESKMLIKETLNILKKAEQQLLQQNSGLNRIVNVSINYSKLNLSGKNITTGRFSIEEKKRIAENIAGYIIGLISNETMLTKPEFIENISISERSEHTLNVILNENYLAKSDFENLFIKTIEAKEKKYQSYTEDKSLDELWLLIVVSAVSSASSYNVENETLSDKLNSKFDRIILFDNFSHEYLNVYQKQ